MTLRLKTLFLVGGSLLALLVALLVATRALVVRSFDHEEEASTAEAVQRVKLVLEGIERDHAEQYRDWAYWDDAYEFVRGKNREAFIKSNLESGSLVSAGAQYIAFLDVKGRSVYSTYFTSGPAKREPVPAALARRLHAGDPLLTHRSGRQIKTEIFALPQGPFLVASLPITPSEATGPIGGTFLESRYIQLDQTRARALAYAQSLSFLPLKGSSLNRADQMAFAAVSNGEGTFVVRLNENTVAGYTVIKDGLGQPVSLLRIELPRTTSQRGKRTFEAFVLVLVICGTLFTFLALYPLERWVLRRLEQLTQDLTQIRQSGDFSLRVAETGADEMSLLMRDINATLVALQSTSGQLKTSEALYREMAQTAMAAGDAFLVASVDFASVEWHGDIDGLLGYPPGGFARTWENWFATVDERDREALQNAYLSARAGEAFQLEIRIHDGAGRVRHWLHRGRLVPGEFGKPDTLLGVCLDVSERIQALGGRREVEERLSRVLTTAADAILITDAAGNITFANLAAERMFGLPAEAICRRTIFDPAWGMETPDGQPFSSDHCAFEKVRASGHPVYNLEHAIKAGPGRMIISVNAAPLTDSEGTFSGVVASVTDVTERHQAQERLAHQAFHDLLTGLPNRSLLLNRLEHALQRRDGRIAVLFLDLDNFKKVNDGLGHEAGDRLLQEVAERLRTTLRAGDTASRFGGDEFVLLLDAATDGENVFGVANRVLDELQEPFWLDQNRVQVTPSIGIALSHQGQDESAEELIRQADAAMYTAKLRGKARYEVFAPGADGVLMTRAQHKAELDRALQGGEFSLAYQPRIDLASGRIVGAEALLRWNHPTRGEVLPLEFLPVAEETGLVGPLGLWILAHCCRQLQQWQGFQDPEFTLSINLSARQFGAALRPAASGAAREPSDPTLEAALAVNLANHSLTAGQLVFEIPEQVLWDEPGSLLVPLYGLAAMGPGLALDAYGNHNTPLPYLKNLEFRYLKYSRSAIKELLRPENRAALLQAVEHCRAAGLTMVALGIENAEEAELLRAAGCHQAQGYHWTRALNADAFERHYSQHHGTLNATE